MQTYLTVYCAEQINGEINVYFGVIRHLESAVKYKLQMKTFTILFTLLITMTFFVSAQEKKISIGIESFIEGMDYKFIETDINTNYEYSSSIAYAFGIGVKYQVIEKLSIKTGISYSEQGYNLSYNYIFMDSRDPLISRESKLSVSYIRIPIMIGYEIFGNEKFGFNPSIGMDLNFQVNDSEITTFEDGNDSNTNFRNQDLNSLLAILKMNFRFEYYIGEQIEIGLSPFIGKGLNKMDNESMVSGQLSYGISLGIYYHF